MDDEAVDLRSYVLNRIRLVMDSQGLAVADLEDRLRVERGWFAGVQINSSGMSLDVLGSIMCALGIKGSQIFPDGPVVSSSIDQPIRYQEGQDGLRVVFPSGGSKADYFIADATLAQMHEVEDTLRKGVRKGATQGIANAFRTAMSKWPKANPSDIWTFVIQRMFIDRRNHPDGTTTDLGQSWKRASGGAFEIIIRDRYNPVLKPFGIRLTMDEQERARLLDAAFPPATRDRDILLDKLDLALAGTRAGSDVEELFGIVHAKVSIAERRTDDIPMSQAVQRAGYPSYAVLMDVKSWPTARPIKNGGELQTPEQPNDKRHDFERGNFTAAVSYNLNTVPTRDSDRRAGGSGIYACDFTPPTLADPFVKMVLAAWERHRTTR